MGSIHKSNFSYVLLPMQINIHRILINVYHSLINIWVFNHIYMANDEI